jgi:hypothetical protein
MGAVVGAHGKGGKIIQIPLFRSAKGLLFGGGIAGEYHAGENFLGNVIDLHWIDLLVFLLS